MDRRVKVVDRQQRQRMQVEKGTLRYFMHLAFNSQYPGKCLARKSVCECVRSKLKKNSCRVYKDVRLPDCCAFTKLKFVDDRREHMAFASI